MAIKLIQVVGIVLVSMITVGNAIKCHLGGETLAGLKIPEVEFDCTRKILGITYLNKCFVSQIKTSEKTVVVYGCLVNQPNIEKNVCGVNTKLPDGTIVKGCCCEGNLCNDKNFQRQCTGSS